MPGEIESNIETYTPHREQALRCALTAGLAMMLACMLVGQLSTTLTVTRAAVPAESAAAKRMHDAGPTMTRMGSLGAAMVVAACGLLGVGYVRRRDKIGAMTLLVTALAAAGAAWPFVRGWARQLTPQQMPPAGSLTGQAAFIGLTLACLSWMVNSWHRRHRLMTQPYWSSASERLDRVVVQAGARDILAVLPGFLLLAMFASALASATETAVHTLPVVSENTVDFDTLPYWEASLSAAVLFGALHGLLLASAAGMVWLRARRAHRRGRPAHVGSLVGAAAGTYLFLFCFFGLAWIFAPEIMELGLTTGVVCLLLMLAMPYSTFVAWNLVRFSRQPGRPRSISDLIRLALLAGVSLGFGVVARLTRRQARAQTASLIIACLVIGAVTTVLLWASFPEVVDHTSRADVLWATGVTLAAVYLLSLLMPPNPKWWRPAVTACMVLVIGSATLFASSRSTTTVRMALYQYSAIARSHLYCAERLYTNCPSWEDDPPSKPSTPSTRPKPQRPEPQIWPELDAIKAKKPLIVFVILDGCRPDRMGVYGYRRNTTPFLNSCKDDWIIFTNAFSQSTGTSCSMRHVFTGRYSSRYMLLKKGIGPFFLNDLIRGGYHTLHLNIIGSDHNGISKEAFTRDMPAAVRSRVKIVVDENQKARKKMKCLLEYLGNNRDSAAGTFAYIHCIDTHSPWGPLEDAPDFGTRQEDYYDEAVANSDLAMKDLITGLKKLGLYDDTILIVSADHGTGLMEHGRYGGFHPHYEQIHVPLLMHVPGFKGRRVEAMTGLFDIGPTLVKALTDEPIDRFDARSLWPAIIDGETMAPRVLYGLSAFSNCYFLVDSDGLHYIWDRGEVFETLFNYKKDPLEKRLLIDDETLLKTCQERMRKFLKTGEGRYTHPSHYRAP